MTFGLHLAASPALKKIQSARSLWRVPRALKIDELTTRAEHRSQTAKDCGASHSTLRCFMIGSRAQIVVTGMPVAHCRDAVLRTTEAHKTRTALPNSSARIHSDRTIGENNTAGLLHEEFRRAGLAHHGGGR